MLHMTVPSILRAEAMSASFITEQALEPIFFHLSSKAHLVWKMRRHMKKKAKQATEIWHQDMGGL